MDQALIRERHHKVIQYLHRAKNYRGIVLKIEKLVY